jgi:crossover junction endodeoxyribonuclease RuvC
MANTLGIDPSSVATGWGVLNEAGELIDWGVIKPNKKKLNEPQQAAFQYNALAEIIEKHKITQIGCEDQHRGPNADTFKKLSRISGYVMLLAGQYDLPIEFFHPSSWRKSVLGKGNAKKEDALNWVKDEYQLLLTEKQNDIAEGIGIAKAAAIHFSGDDVYAKQK